MAVKNSQLEKLRRETGAANVGTSDGNTVDGRLINVSQSLVDLANDAMQTQVGNAGAIQAINGSLINHGQSIQENADAIVDLDSDNESNKGRLQSLEDIEDNRVILRPRSNQVHIMEASSQVLSGGVSHAINGVECSIVPQHMNSKILVLVRWSGEVDTITNYNSVFQLMRNGVFIGHDLDVGHRNAGLGGVDQGFYEANASSTQDSFKGFYLDGPNSTDEQIYSLSIRSSVSCTLYNNRTVVDINSLGHERLTSSVVLLEVLPQ